MTAVSVLKFHLDENVSRFIASGLRRRGVDVTTSPEQQLLAASDEEQLAFARSQERVLVTHDDDFLKLHSQGQSHSGIVYLRHQKQDVGRVIQRLLTLWRTCPTAEMIGRVQFF